MIRAMKTDDIAAVQQIAKISWNDTYENIIPIDVQNSFLQKAYSHAMMLKRLEKTYVYVAVHDEEVVGFANFTRVDDDGDSELTAIYILPTHQRFGYGKKLLAEGLKHIPKAQQLLVYVESDNQKGRSFYENNDFECIEEFDEYFEGHPLSTAKYVHYVKTPVNN